LASSPRRTRRRAISRALRRALVLLPAALACAALWPAASSAFVGCGHSAGTLNVFLNQEDDAVTVSRGGDAINVVSGGAFNEGPSLLLVCTGDQPTVNNTDQIVIDQAAVADFSTVSIDLGGGPLAPGMTPEADGTSEIEIRANLFAGLSFMGIEGTPQNDNLHLGTVVSGATGVNLNAGAEAAPDVDLELAQPELLAIAAGGGNDLVRGRGSPGFAGPVKRVEMLVDGGRGRDELIAGRFVSLLSGAQGNDRLLGSRELDLIQGGPGRDLIKSGRGTDQVFAAREGRDRDNCGGGRDRVSADDSDRVGKCEREFKRRGNTIDLGFLIQVITGGGFSAHKLSADAIHLLNRK
jgi:hypothetical protein